MHLNLYFVEMSSGCDENSSNRDIIQVTVHCSDNLKTKILLLQPAICMHVIDEKTGTYLKKSDKYASHYSIISLIKIFSNTQKILFSWLKNLLKIG